MHSGSAPRRQNERCGGCGRRRHARTTGSGRDVPIHAGGVPDGSRRSPWRGDLRFRGPSRRHPGGGARGPGSRCLASRRDAFAGTRLPPGVSRASSRDPRLPSDTPPAWVRALHPASSSAPSAQFPMSGICGGSRSRRVSPVIANIGDWETDLVRLDLVRGREATWMGGPSAFCTLPSASRFMGTSRIPRVRTGIAMADLRAGRGP